VSASVLVIPATFATAIADRPAVSGCDGKSWLRDLPRLISDCVEQWDLKADGEPQFGSTALVLPYLRDDRPIVLKVTWPHPEARFEHLALRQWDGRGAVRLFAADPTRWALSLERLDSSRTLETLPILDACRELGDLFRRLDAPPVARVDDLPTHSTRWSVRCRVGSPHVPRRMSQQAASMLQDLGPDSAKDLVHTDLHFTNVLAAQRDPWLAIDPKPINGEWEFAVAPALWNRWDEALKADSVRAHLRTRLSVICQAADLDEDRARDWSFIRLVLNALAEAEDSAPDQAALSRYVIAAKAMQE